MEKAKNKVHNSKIEASGNIEIGDKSTTNLTVNKTSNTNIPVIVISAIALLLTYGVLTNSASMVKKNPTTLTETPIRNNTETPVNPEALSRQTSIPIPSKPADKTNQSKEKSNQETTSTPAQPKQQTYYLKGYVFDLATHKPQAGIEISYSGKTVITDTKGYFFLPIATLPTTNMAAIHFSGQGYNYTKLYTIPRKNNLTVYLQK